MPAPGPRTDYDRQKADAFGARLVGTLNSGALSLMMSVSHRTGFSARCGRTAST
jgi:hypothetical protein